MRNIKKIGATLVGILMICSFASVVSADSGNVTVTWIIPADVSVTITYPTGEGKIVFEPGAKTFGAEPARSQTPATAGMNLENIGNTALQINFTFSDAWYDAGLNFFNCSVDDNTNTSLYFWTNSNETANWTVVASLGVGANEDFWFWSSGANCLESAVGEDTETLVVYYTNA